jgi:hypothetical protein
MDYKMLLGGRGKWCGCIFALGAADVAVSVWIDNQRTNGLYFPRH